MTIAKLGTKHFKTMRILTDVLRTYVEYKHCPSTQLDPKYHFGCPSFSRTLFKLDINCNMDILFTDKVEDIVKAEINAIGTT